MPLMYTDAGFFKAIAKGNTALVESYLARDAAYYTAIKDKKGNTPLILAAGGNRNTASAKLLIAAGAAVNAQNASGETPLLSAISNNNTAIAEALLAAAADPNLAAYGGGTPAVRAVNRSNAKVMQLLIAHGADISEGDLVNAAVKRGNSQLLSLLLENGGDVNKPDGNGNLPMYYAGMANSTDIARLLLEKGADINARDPSSGATALHLAVSYGRNTVVEYLAENGARLDVRNNEGQTPLMLARDRQAITLIDILAAAEKTTVDAATPQAPTLSAATTTGGTEDWMRLGDARVAYIGTWPALGRRLTEIFNFESRERLTITENLKTGAETTTPPDSFDNIADAALQKALRAFTTLGGTADPATVFGGTTKKALKPQG